MPVPERPWQIVGSDLFYFQGATYLFVVDYFSRFVEVARLSSTTSEDIVVLLRSMFCRHGIPEIFISDNGPQYASKYFDQFAKEYEFEHCTRSPRYPQSNGEAERTVQTVKHLLYTQESQRPVQGTLSLHPKWVQPCRIVFRKETDQNYYTHQARPT